ncbi:pilus assembly protein HicB [Prevotella intermedia]|uniref:pilus assembly protein HicB n=1 Tax=Prevotella intermedia TaxID=28131 RepID=UPI000C1C8380|nr:pilus assembly protein HicB [Prevotella intermedia]ATV32551.1 pilus assembly protein HicB [Prevotella intermedia]ATV41038.1 pilus assembly protein HicB [Prevotella intermedia]MCK6143373.1 pilus assembly protein HicB [Prevotella intermedia]
MTTINERKITVTIEKDTDGSYIAYNTDDSPYTLIGRGATVNEAKADFENSIKEIAESEKERVGTVPAILKGKPSFKFDLASLFTYYSMLNVSAFARFVGINATLMRQYKKGDTYISERQLKKIEEGIHKLGAEFTSLKLV